MGMMIDPPTGGVHATGVTREPSGQSSPDATQTTSGGGETTRSSTPYSPPTLSLPKGGGAIRGIGEKFAANPVTGTSSLTVPIPVSPGRSGSQPQLALSYDSGAGNGSFGLGWSIGLPSITRKTDKGLPTYDDGSESDVFILSGAEDLVPALRLTATGDLERDGENQPVLDEDDRDGYHIVRYRPRTEGLFARIERWTKHGDRTDVFWRTISRDNVTSIFGRESESRIYDPAAASHVFSWLICESYDDKGNGIQYEYKAEDGAGVDLALPYEQHRRDAACTTQRYIKVIRYGNTVSRLHPEPPADWRDEWLFEVLFDYGEGHYEDLPLDPGTPADEQHRFSRASLASDGDWLVRPDPFSTYRAGFEVRTYRRCRRVLMFHRIDELGVEPYLVRGVELDYADLDSMDPVVSHELGHAGSTRFASFLVAATQHGYEQPDAEVTAGPHAERYLSYLRQSMPPITLSYSKPTIGPEIRTLDATSASNLPVGISDPYHWVDLDGEGLSGVLTDQGGAWWYKRNSGTGRLGELELVASRPGGGLSGRQLLDLAGDGSLDLVEFDGPAPGFYERTDDEDWAPHRSFASLPNVRWDNRNLRFTDVNGDGHADVLITESDAFTWHPSLGEQGFGPARRTVQPFDEVDGPRLVFADGTNSVYLADMSGDGQTDLVRIANGEVCYWPNLGYGRFGAKVVMDNPPTFDHQEQFADGRVRLADIDGSGVTDIVYLGRDDTRVYFNQSGNRWAEALTITEFPLSDNVSAVSTVDLLGNGTTCLVWSSPLAGDAQAPMKYIDLMATGKPHVLVEIHNNLGAETSIHYAPSTHFYLADKEAGQPWITRLPFPVQVVERVETTDRISRNRFVSRYAYHHGYFDGIEREFRGFGRVDQYDTEEYELLELVDGEPDPPNYAESSYIPTVLTRSWFHTGAYLGRARISQQYAAEYYRGPGLADADAAALLLDDTLLPADLSLDEERQACRALRGSALRQEVYALDGSEEDGYPFGHPYVVTENNFGVRLVQPQGSRRHGVFLTHASEAISYEYERNPADPRVAHTLTLAVNPFGQVTRAASIGYGRHVADPDLAPELQAEQQRLLATVTETIHTNALIRADDKFDDHRTPAPYDTRTYQLTGLEELPHQPRFTLKQVADATAGAQGLSYHETPTEGSVEKRLIECQRIRFREDDLSGPCGWGDLASRGLPFEAYRLAFTPGLLERTYRRTLGAVDEDLLPDPAAVLPIDETAAGDTAAGLGGYVDLDADGAWWIPTGRPSYIPDPQATPALELEHARRHFFIPHRYRSPFHTAGTPTETTVTYDDHDLLTVATADALGNQTTAELDYRVVAPKLLTDANGNQSAVAFDALGMVVATAITGKAGAVPREGDELAEFSANLTAAELGSAFADPFTAPHLLIGKATTRLVYDLFAYQRTKSDEQPAPAAVYALARETHVGPGDAQTALQHAFSYSDGFGREMQKKVQAEPGPGPARDAGGDFIIVDGRPQLTAGDLPHRWVGSGWTEFNNKGKPVRRYEPFFADTHLCDFEAKIGVTKTLFYNPVERLVAVLHPNHTYEKVVFDPWGQVSFDVNDTVSSDPRTDPDIASLVHRYFQQEDAAWQTWLTQRQAPGAEVDETNAATKASAHANTPTTAYLDTLGRTFLTRAHNGFAANGDPVHLDTRAIFDIEGNQRAVIDAEDRTVMTYDYDMLGNRTRQSSMEAGERWMLNDLAGNLIRAWDSRGHDFRTEYDPLRRPARSFVRGSGTASDPDTRGVSVLYQRVEYGEGQANAAANNLRGRVFRQSDGAGLVTHWYDFKGNITAQARELAPGYKTVIDWAAAQPAGERFVAATRYDALNRPIQIVAPHLDDAAANRNVVQPVYNEANLLDKLLVWTARASDPGGLLDPALEAPGAVGVDGIDYDAKGQRARIAYRNGVTTTYEYDPDTFRVVHVYTRRGPTFTDDCGGAPPPPRAAAPDRPPPGKPCGLQNLHYTYDPVGNVTHIRDDAQQIIFFRNQIVEPSNDYTYDPIYQLVQALGREHVGQAGGDGIPHDYNDFQRKGLPHSADGNAMGRYCETYEYDRAGNMQAMKHHKACPGAVDWSRTYDYNEASQLDDRGLNGALRQSNRLSTSTVAGVAETYSTDGDGYDPHGNMLRMPQLQELAWNFHDQLRMTRRQAVNAGDADGVERQGERTYYLYDATGQRVRKVTETAAGAVKEERLYLGGFEIYRKHSGQNAGLVRETLHVMDDQQRIALVETRNDVDDGTQRELIRYQLPDHLGSSNVEVDDQAQIISREEFSPFGSTTYQAQRTDVEVAAKRYRYTGKERDEESGLSYHAARYCALWLGRWSTVDPAGLADGLNLYAYARQNPVKHTDARGTGCDGSTASCPELMNNWSYGSPVPDRNDVGHNVQRDHPIQVNLRSEQRGGRYNRTVSAARSEQTVLAETGRGYFHTEVGKLQKEVNARVRAGLITTESELIEATREAYRLAAETTGVAVNEQALDRAIVSNLGTLSETAATTRSELSAVTGATTVTEASMEAAFRDPNPPKPAPIKSAPPATPPAPAPEVPVAPEAPAAKPSLPSAPVATVPQAGRLAGAVAWAMEAGPKALTFAGRVLTVFGAAKEAERTVQLERSHNRGELNAALMGTGTFAVGMLAGIVDDAFAVAQVPVMGAPVLTMQSYESRGSGPIQALAGDAVRGLLKIGFSHGF